MDGSHMNSLRRAWEIPEICHIIHNFLDRTDCVRLLYVSRLTYIRALAVVWETTDLKSLLLLIPGSRFVLDGLDHSETAGGFVARLRNVWWHLSHIGSYHEHLPKSLSVPSTPDLMRFNVHSPFVKTLRVICCPNNRLPQMWPGSMPKPLLQGVRSLVIGICPSGPNSSVLSIEWVSQLLAPGLESFEVFAAYGGMNQHDQFDTPPPLHPKIHLQLTEMLSQKCSSIKRLHMPPPEYELENAYGVAHLGISAMANLQVITLVVNNIHSDLVRALGELPRLEFLSLKFTGMSAIEEDLAIAVPNSSFPSLRRLALLEIDDRTACGIFTVVPLLSKLTVASVIFDDNLEFSERGDFQRSIMVVESLSRVDFQIQDLTVHPVGDCGDFGICVPVITSLRRMDCLRILRLGRIGGGPPEHVGEGDQPEYIGDELTESGSWVVQWRAFFSAVPYLKELHIERQEIELQHFELLASLLPHLRLFIFRSVLLDAVTEPVGRLHAAQAITIRCWSYVSTEIRDSFVPQAPNESSPLRAARYILLLWPNVTCEIAENATDEGLPADQATFERLVVAIERLRS